MSREGAPTINLSHLDSSAGSLRVAIVVASWHRDITDAMLADAITVVEAAGGTAEVIRVPGTFELSVAAMRIACSPQAPDAIVALGVVVRGGTPHFDYVCHAATDGLGRVALDTGIPVGFGVLTCDTVGQALERSGLPGSLERKGAEAAEAAIATVVALAEYPRG
ncbi:6,7-dimethyl-8-ribityllumazine synthase [Gulosibacter sp. ACHW.36C]|uniref:6,7-dimethyl-8-ribityllumazine synthase n=1 Tax=Gulosibacter sediminis TaxID=1729695 RepID=A0ABY4MZC4_9MICO|nr:6,7-dimethyl-8-ribityllumazine synthase [Gulosibacter sediminis]UQN15364.1 6,7-dimethyl-8-ribityllumazine synthase [Gulosibacter sediminis]